MRFKIKSPTIQGMSIISASRIEDRILGTWLRNNPEGRLVHFDNGATQYKTPSSLRYAAAGDFCTQTTVHQDNEMIAQIAQLQVKDDSFTTRPDDALSALTTTTPTESQTVIKMTISPITPHSNHSLLTDVLAASYYGSDLESNNKETRKDIKKQIAKSKATKKDNKKTVYEYNTSKVTLISSLRSDLISQMSVLSTTEFLTAHKRFATTVA